jgi:hypothetical protein
MGSVMDGVSGNGEQTPMSFMHHDRKGDTIRKLVRDNCAIYDMPEVAEHPYAGLLHFMSSALSRLDAQIIQADPSAFLEAMHHTNVFASNGEDDHILIHNVVGTVNPVKAKMVYAQVPNKETGKVEVYSAMRVSLDSTAVVWWLIIS